MKIVIQRVRRAGVSVGCETVAEIRKGLLIFVGVGKFDTADDAARLAKKIANLRVFEDQNGKMNLNILDAGGTLLSVSQFTLFADTKKGNRPGFDMAAPPETGKKLWEFLNNTLKEQGVTVSTGIFGAKMAVTLVNDGPVTIILDSEGTAAA